MYNQENFWQLLQTIETWLNLLQLAHLAEEAEMEQFYMELKELYQQLSAYFLPSLMSFYVNPG
jgi:hypothetical protein